MKTGITPFANDCFAFAAMAIIAAEYDSSRTSFLVVPLLFFHFIFDTVFTFCRRVIRGDNVTQAHRTHLYQLINRLGVSHARVSLIHFAIAIAQGVGAIVLIGLGPENRMLVFVPFVVFQIGYATVVMVLARQAGLLAVGESR